eukprot:GILK01000428.1.p1 GENE.GILK01000428.1~~GILK01000428.1.p1  ORF type:complete len:673 (-),score=53.37 GILK01000428.1:161-2134(-)
MELMRFLLLLLLGFCLCANAEYQPGACRHERKQSDVDSCVLRGDWLCEWCDMSALPTPLTPEQITAMNGADAFEYESESLDSSDLPKAPKGFPFRCARRWTAETCPGGKIFYLKETGCEKRLKWILREQQFFDDLDALKEKKKVEVAKAQPEDDLLAELRQTFEEAQDDFAYDCTSDSNPFPKSERYELKSERHELVRTGAWLELLKDGEHEPREPVHVPITLTSKHKHMQEAVVADRLLRPYLTQKTEEPLAMELCTQWTEQDHCYLAGCMWCPSSNLEPHTQRCQPFWFENECRNKGAKTRRGQLMTRSTSETYFDEFDLEPQAMAEEAFKRFKAYGWYPMPGADVNQIKEMKVIAKVSRVAARAAFKANHNYRGGTSSVMTNPCAEHRTLFKCVLEGKGCSWCMDPLPLEDLTNKDDRDVVYAKARCSLERHRNIGAKCYSTTIKTPEILNAMELEFIKAYKNGLPAEVTEAQADAMAARVLQEVQEQSVQKAITRMQDARTKLHQLAVASGNLKDESQLLPLLGVSSGTRNVQQVSSQRSSEQEEVPTSQDTPTSRFLPALATTRGPTTFQAKPKGSKLQSTSNVIVPTASNTGTTGEPHTPAKSKSPVNPQSFTGKQPPGKAPATGRNVIRRLFSSTTSGSKETGSKDGQDA